MPRWSGSESGPIGREGARVDGGPGLAAHAWSCGTVDPNLREPRASEPILSLARQASMRMLGLCHREIQCPMSLDCRGRTFPSTGKYIGNALRRYVVCRGGIHPKVSHTACLKMQM